MIQKNNKQNQIILNKQTTSSLSDLDFSALSNYSLKGSPCGSSKRFFFEPSAQGKSSSLARRKERKDSLVLGMPKTSLYQYFLSRILHSKKNLKSAFTPFSSCATTKNSSFSLPYVFSLGKKPVNRFLNTEKHGLLLDNSFREQLNNSQSGSPSAKAYGKSTNKKSLFTSFKNKSFSVRENIQTSFCLRFSESKSSACASQMLQVKNSLVSPWQEQLQNFFPYRKSFLCYWLLPFMGFVFTISKETNKDFISLPTPIYSLKTNDPWFIVASSNKKNFTDPSFSAFTLTEKEKREISFQLLQKEENYVLLDNSEEIVGSKFRKKNVSYLSSKFNKKANFFTNEKNSGAIQQKKQAVDFMRQHNHNFSLFPFDPQKGSKIPFSGIELSFDPFEGNTEHFFLAEQYKNNNSQRKKQQNFYINNDVRKLNSLKSKALFFSGLDPWSKSELTSVKTNRLYPVYQQRTKEMLFKEKEGNLFSIPSKEIQKFSSPLLFLQEEQQAKYYLECVVYLKSLQQYVMETGKTKDALFNKELKVQKKNVASLPSVLRTRANFKLFWCNPLSNIEENKNFENKNFNTFSKQSFWTVFSHSYNIKNLVQKTEMKENDKSLQANFLPYELNVLTQRSFDPQKESKIPFYGTKLAFDPFEGNSAFLQGQRFPYETGQKVALASNNPVSSFIKTSILLDHYLLRNPSFVTRASSAFAPFDTEKDLNSISKKNKRELFKNEISKNCNLFLFFFNEEKKNSYGSLNNNNADTINKEGPPFGSPKLFFFEPSGFEEKQFPSRGLKGNFNKLKGSSLYTLIYKNLPSFRSLAKAEQFLFPKYQSDQAFLQGLNEWSFFFNKKGFTTQLQSNVSSYLTLPSTESTFREGPNQKEENSISKKRVEKLSKEKLYKLLFDSFQGNFNGKSPFDPQKGFTLKECKLFDSCKQESKLKIPFNGTKLSFDPLEGNSASEHNAYVHPKESIKTMPRSLHYLKNMDNYYPVLLSTNAFSSKICKESTRSNKVFDSSSLLKPILFFQADFLSREGTFLFQESQKQKSGEIKTKKGFNSSLLEFGQYSNSLPNYPSQKTVRLSSSIPSKEIAPVLRGRAFLFEEGLNTPATEGKMLLRNLNDFWYYSNYVNKYSSKVKDLLLVNSLTSSTLLKDSNKYSPCFSSNPLADRRKSLSDPQGEPSSARRKQNNISLKQEKILKSFFSIKKKNQENALLVPNYSLKKEKLYNSYNIVQQKLTSVFGYASSAFENSILKTKKALSLTKIKLDRKESIYSPRLLIENRSFILNTERKSFDSSRASAIPAKARMFKPVGFDSFIFSVTKNRKIALSIDKLINIENETLLRSREEENSIEKQRKSIQKKRRRKKLKKETRRRKKRKRFYPRPVWLRYRLFLKLIKKRLLLSKQTFGEFTSNKSGDSFVTTKSLPFALIKEVYPMFSLSSQKVPLAGDQSFFFDPQADSKKSKDKGRVIEQLSAPSIPSKEIAHAEKAKKVVFYRKYLKRKDFNSNNVSTQSAITFSKNIVGTSYAYSLTKKNYKNSTLDPLFQFSTKENFTISPVVLRDLKRLLWKSYWLRSNLNPYLKRVESLLNEVKKSTQKWEYFTNLKSFLRFVGGFWLKEKKECWDSPIISGLPSFTRLQGNKWGTSNPSSGLLGGTPRCTTKDKPVAVSLTAKPLDKWESTLYFAEYNRFTYLRIQELLSQIRENFASASGSFISSQKNYSSSSSHSELPSNPLPHTEPLLLPNTFDGGRQQKQSGSPSALSIPEKEIAHGASENYVSTYEYLKDQTKVKLVRIQEKRLQKEKTTISNNTKNNNKFMKVRSSHISHSKIQDSKRLASLSAGGDSFFERENDNLSNNKDFWVKLGKAMMWTFDSANDQGENLNGSSYFNRGQQTFFKKRKEWWLFAGKDYTNEPTTPQLRMLWALSKTTPSLFFEGWSADSLTSVDVNNKLKTNQNSSLYKRKQTWSGTPDTSKVREQTKYNKTKKMSRTILTKIQTLLNEQYELLGLFNSKTEQFKLKLQDRINARSSSGVLSENQKEAFSSFESLNNLDKLFKESLKKTRKKEEKLQFLKNRKKRFFYARPAQATKNMSVTNNQYKRNRIKENVFLLHEYKKQRKLEPLNNILNNNSGSKTFFNFYLSKDFTKEIQPENLSKPEPWLNTLTSKSSYWWTQQRAAFMPLHEIFFPSVFPNIEDSILQFVDTKNSYLPFSLKNKTFEGFTVFPSTGSKESLVPSASKAFALAKAEKGIFDFDSCLQESNNLHTLSVKPFWGSKQKQEKSSMISNDSILFENYQREIWICTFLFHFCSILSLLSISQIRDLLKFYLLGISKLYKSSFGMFTYSYNSFQRLKGNYDSSTAYKDFFSTKKEELTLSTEKRVYNKKGDFINGKPSYSFDKALLPRLLQTKLLSRRGTFFQGEKIEQKNVFIENGTKRSNLLRGRPTIIPFGNNSIYNEERVYSLLALKKFKEGRFFDSQLALKETKTEKSALFPSTGSKESLVPSASKAFALAKAEKGIFDPFWGSKAKAEKGIFDPIWGLKASKTFARAKVRKPFFFFKSVNIYTKQFALKETVLQNKRKTLLTTSTKLYSLFFFNSFLNKNFNIILRVNNLLTQTFNLFGRFGPKSLFNFLEKPGELIIDWIAYLFLVEWASDVTNTIPENFDFYIGSTFSKTTRTLYSLNILTNNSILNIQNLSLTPVLLPILQEEASVLTKQNFFYNKNSSLLNLGSVFIKHRIYHLYEILLFQFYQPDTDLIVRQKKGVIFWDVWGDFLMQVAEDYNINISELTSLKEEQIKLFEKSSELVLKENKRKTNEISFFNVHTSSLALLFEKSSYFYGSWMKLLPKEKPLKKDKESTTGVFSFAQQREVYPSIHQKIRGISKQTTQKIFFSSAGRKDFWSVTHLGAQPNAQAPFSIEKGSPSAFACFSPNPKAMLVQGRKASKNNFAAQQFLSYQGKDTELFIDLHPPKSFSMISLLKNNESVQTSLGPLVCQIFAGIMSKQISKNLLIVGRSEESSNAMQSSLPSFTLKSTLNESKNKKLERFNLGFNTLVRERRLKNAIDLPINAIYQKDYNKAISAGNSSANGSGFEKTLLIQAIAGETELKIITDNAYRYAMVYRGVAVGIKLLRDVFDSLSLHTPCLFLIEDIHAIGERRPLLISDDDKGASSSGKTFFGSQQEEIHEKNQVLYQLSKHVITHYRKPYKGDFSLLIPTNQFCFDLFRNNLNYSTLDKANTNSSFSSASFKRSKVSFSMPKIAVQSKNANDSSFSGMNGGDSTTTEKGTSWLTLTPDALSLIKSEKGIIDTQNKEFKHSLFLQNRAAISSDTFAQAKSIFLQQKRKPNSRLLIKSSQFFAPPATSPFSLLNLKEEKKFKPYKIVSEMPWGGLPGELLAQVSKASYSVRVKVAMLADMAISTLSVKLDMITDLLVIIDSVKANRGFVVFATTHVPYILDPALRRPGRLDETITLGLFPNLLSRWEILKSSFGLFTAGKEQTGLTKGVSLDLTYSIDSPYLNFLSSKLYYKKNFFVKKFSSFAPLKEQELLLAREKKLSISKTNYSTFCLIETMILKEKAFNKKISQSKVFKSEKYIYKGSPSGSPKQKSYLHKILLAPFSKEKGSPTGQAKLLRKQKSETYFIASNMLYEANENSSFMLPISHYKTKDSSLLVSKGEKMFFTEQKEYSPKKQNFIDSLQPLNMENSSSLYISLYASPLQFKNYIIKLVSGKIGEMLLFSNSFNYSSSQTFETLFPLSGSKAKAEKGIFDPFSGSKMNKKRKADKGNSLIYKENMIQWSESLPTSFGLSSSWKVLSLLILSFVQKRSLLVSNCSARSYVSTYSSSISNEGKKESGFIVNNNLIVPKFLFFKNYNTLNEPPSPPSSNILLPARRYENYRRSFASFSGRNISNGIMEKIQTHQQQRLVKKLYGLPVQNSFKSEILENRFTNFTNASLMIGSFSTILQKPSNSNWFFKNRILMRHKDYLTNQWWNGQLPEHNAETTFLSDIDWRYSFVESIGDLLLDFPDADQHYSPKNRRWLLTKGEYHNWYSFEKTLYSEIYTHFIFDSFIQAFHIYEVNREVLDFYAFYVLRKGLNNFINEFETLKLYKRFLT